MDSYTSKPRGRWLCQAGSETWFRVIDLRARVERYAKPVDSCYDDAPGLSDPAFTIADDGSRVTVHLLAEPDLIVTLGADGRVTTSR